MTAGQRARQSRPPLGFVLALIAAITGAAIFWWRGSSRRRGTPPVASGPSSAEELTPAAPAPSPTPDPATWAAAVARVEEPRGSSEPLRVPVELQHYNDNRRFLAVQMADSRVENYELPHDQAELAEMVRRGDLVEVKALGEDYLLYDVGTALREDPLTHYDVATGA